MNQIYFLFYKHPVAAFMSSLISFLLCVISIVCIFVADYHPDTAMLILLFALPVFLLTTHINIIKDKVMSMNITEYFVENQHCVARDEEIEFFVRESHKAGFGQEFENYLKNLGRKPLIGECLKKAMKLQDSTELEA